MEYSDILFNVKITINKNMETELKKKIIDSIFENANDFQLVNNTIDNFRSYIYYRDGSYLIGGEAVAEFIKKAIELIK